MKNNDIVAEYDYYTLAQARKIIYEETRKKKREIREECMSVVSMIVIPVLFVLHWIVFGY